MTGRCPSLFIAGVSGCPSPSGTTLAFSSLSPFLIAADKHTGDWKTVACGLCSRNGCGTFEWFVDAPVSSFPQILQSSVLVSSKVHMRMVCMHACMRMHAWKAVINRVQGHQHQRHATGCHPRGLR